MKHMNRQAKPAAEGAEPQGEQQGEPLFELNTSRQFEAWLSDSGASLAFTTYQAGKLFLLGLKDDGRLSVFTRTLPRCMGMTAAGHSLYVSTLYQILRFEQILEPGQGTDGYDAVYVPQVSYFTADLDVHDMALDGEGRLLFANTLFSCVAAASATHSFVPVWQPPFIGKLAAEDRCHLNGLAMENGKPRYVTAVADSDVADGWRDRRRDGGVLIDVESGEVAVAGLSMPHSPRVYQGKVWLHDSGSGRFGYADLEAGRFEPVAFCPGYLRGLSFIGDYAVAGLSKPRENKTFTGLGLDDSLAERQMDARCALYVIDLRSGDVVHWARLEGVVQELYDVVALPGVRRPMAIGFRSEEIRRVVSIGDAAATAYMTAAAS